MVINAKLLGIQGIGIQLNTIISSFDADFTTAFFDYWTSPFLFSAFSWAVESSLLGRYLPKSPICTSMSRLLIFMNYGVEYRWICAPENVDNYVQNLSDFAENESFRFKACRHKAEKFLLVQ